MRMKEPLTDKEKNTVCSLRLHRHVGARIFDSQQTR